MDFDDLQSLAAMLVGADETGLDPEQVYQLRKIVGKSIVGFAAGKIVSKDGEQKPGPIGLVLDNGCMAWFMQSKDNHAPAHLSVDDVTEQLRESIEAAGKPKH